MRFILYSMYSVLTERSPGMSKMPPVENRTGTLANPEIAGPFSCDKKGRRILVMLETVDMMSDWHQQVMPPTHLADNAVIIL